MKHLRLSLVLFGFAILGQLFFPACNNNLQESGNFKNKAVSVLKDSILLLARQNLKKLPVTITSYRCKRSKGTVHDFYSEGDYWWPNPKNPKGPYIRRDGLSNPDNFTKHREALIRFSRIAGNLTSAYLITGDSLYAKAFVKHLEAWFVNDCTRMNPNLHYAQAITGRCEGRYIGIIDGIHFLEVAQSVLILERNHLIRKNSLSKIKKWFSDYLYWLTTSPYGKQERIHPNNHGTWWNVQAAMYAVLTQNEKVLDECRTNFKLNLLPNQEAPNGSFPEELKRTKPYGYSLFNLEGMTMNVLLLSTKGKSLWNYQTPYGKSLRKAIQFMAPYINDKSKWPYPPDVMYWNKWPVAQPSLLFASIQYDDKSWFRIWSKYRHFLKNNEVIRNMPIRNPVLWFSYLPPEKELLKEK